MGIHRTAATRWVTNFHRKRHVVRTDPDGQRGARALAQVVKPTSICHQGRLCYRRTATCVCKRCGIRWGSHEGEEKAWRNAASAFLGRLIPILHVRWVEFCLRQPLLLEVMVLGADKREEALCISFTMRLEGACCLFRKGKQNPTIHMETFLG